MRAVALLAILTLAGCTSPDPVDAVDPVSPPTDGGSPDDVPTAPAAPFALHLNGTLWITPPSGPDRFEKTIAFQVNATSDLQVTVHVASTLTPIPTASVEAELRDGSGSSLAQATFWPPVLRPDRQTLDLSDVVPGTYDLHVAAWGGSDGSSGGDHIDYEIHAAAGTGEQRFEWGLGGDRVGASHA